MSQPGYVPRPTRIGSDECGKGDYFGPLVVSACLVEPRSEAALVGLGVTDSKRLSDARNRALAVKIKRIVPAETVRIGPKRYNELYAKLGNLNKLLAWAHAKAIAELLTRYPEVEQVVTDKFGPEVRLESALARVPGSLEIVQIVGGERDVAVAAASVVARADFLTALERLGEEHGVTLPKGATHVLDAARAIHAAGGMAKLAAVAKLHFRTTREVTG